MSAPRLSGQGALLPSLAFLGASVSWFLFEHYATQGYTGSQPYDWSVASLSDLSVPYRQVHPLKHQPVLSIRAKSQNFNFQLNGVLFAVAQMGLLFLTRKGVSAPAGTARKVRLGLSLLVVLGMTLLSQFHGGPREQKWGTIGWHWNGLALVAVAGNANSILSGLVTGQIGQLDRSIIYRAISVILGAVGLYSFYQFQTLGAWNFETKLGLWQRGMIYPIQAWQATTAIGLLAGSYARGSIQTSKTKRT